MTYRELCEMLEGEICVNSVSGCLTDLVRSGMVRREGASRKAYTYYLATPATPAKPVTPPATPLPSSSAKAKPLADYTPREMLEELKRRGYVWDKMWVETRQFVEYGKI